MKTEEILSRILKFREERLRIRTENSQRARTPVYTNSKSILLSSTKSKRNISPISPCFCDQFSQRKKNELQKFVDTHKNQQVTEFKLPGVYLGFEIDSERTIKDLTLSSIISYDDKTLTERMVNFNRIAPSAKMFSIKKSSDSESNSELGSGSFKIPKVEIFGNKQACRFIKKPLGIISFVHESHLKTFAFGVLKEAFAKRLKEYVIGKFRQLLLKHVKVLLKQIMKVRLFPSRFLRVCRSFKEKSRLPMMKMFLIWKILSKNMEQSNEYIIKVTRSLRTLNIILKYKEKTVLSSAFCSLQNLLTFRKLQKTGVICLVNALKRSIRISKHRLLVFSLNLLLIISRELHIKQQAIRFIVKNVSKDITFRLNICFAHWKELNDDIKDRRLKALACFQIFAGILKSKEKYAFSILSHYESSFIMTKKNMKNLH